MGEINWGQRNESKGRKGNERGGGMSPKWRYKATLNKKGKFVKARKRKGAEGC